MVIPTVQFDKSSYDQSHLVGCSETYVIPGEYTHSRLRLQDAICTMVYVVSPGALTPFLNPKTKSFQLVVKVTDEDGHTPRKIVIKKVANEVMVRPIYADRHNTE